MTHNPRDRFRNDPDPRKRFADVFINGEPVVSPPLLPRDQDLEERERYLKRLESMPHAHPMKEADRLPEGQGMAIFIGKRKPPKRPS